MKIFRNARIAVRVLRIKNNTQHTNNNHCSSLACMCVEEFRKMKGRRAYMCIMN